MATASPVQSAAGAITWTVNWTKQLAKAGTGLTLTSATVTCDNAAVLIGGVSFDNATVSFRLSTLALTGTPLYVPVRVTVGLSNGDTDPRTIDFQIID